jgi:tetratricopeptide (TPR) repeat protein
MKVVFLAKSFILTVALSVFCSPAWSADPFRSSNSRQIGDKTEAAFNTLFKEGNYQQAKTHLVEAEQLESNEPLIYALRASLAYTENDWDTLKDYASKTLEKAKQLTSQDPLRGNLYTAVGLFLEGAYEYHTDGPVGALAKLQQVFQELDEAAKNDPEDPELNLIQGYMDLMLAVNLPFSNPDKAIDRLTDYAAPDYLVLRGIAIAYRDLDKYERGLESVDRAIQLAPDNPELYYLKAQILYKQGKKENDRSLLTQAVENFERASQKKEQLPNLVVESLVKEQERAKKRLASL